MVSMASRLHAESVPAIAVAEPEGFATIAAERIVLIDLFYGEEMRGEAQITVAPGTIRFNNPEAVMRMLPPLTNEKEVLASLENNTFPAHQALRCTAGAPPSMCGRLTPSLIGVIYDPEKFRLDVFLRPDLVVTHPNSQPEFLPAPEGDLSIINSISATVSGEINRSETYVSAFDNVIVGLGEQRFRADLGYASGIGLEVDRANLEVDRAGVRYLAGIMWSPGTLVGGRRKFVGGGIESQRETRLDREAIAGTPIVFYLDQRSRVDVVRDGKVLASAIYEPGSQQIDTSPLPEGSYNVILRVHEAGRPTREERRFFTKSRQIPSLRQTDYFLYSGFLTNEYRSRFEQSGNAYVHGGVALRPLRSVALAGAVELVEGVFSTEVSATFLSPVAQIRASAVVETEGAKGGILQISSSGTSRFNFNFDLRRISGGDYTREEDIEQQGHPLWPIGTNRDDFRTDYTQMGGLLAYNIPDVRFLASGYYRRDSGHDATFSFGPAIEWDVFRRRPVYPDTAQRSRGHRTG